MKINEDLGVDATGRDFLPFSDLEQSMRDAVETLCDSEIVPNDITISGAIYDVQSGEQGRQKLENQEGATVRPGGSPNRPSPPVREALGAAR